MTGLTFTAMVKNETNNTYKSHLKLNGRRVIIATPLLHQKKGLKFLVKNNMTAVLVPLDPDTISVLKEIENFTKENIDSERYKPLWLKNAMFVNVSKWCEYELIASDGSPQPFPENQILDTGLYRLEIHVSHVYIGPHKGGETFSLSLHVTKISYEPQEDIEELMNDFVKSLETEQQNPVSTSEKKQQVSLNLFRDTPDEKMKSTTASSKPANRKKPTISEPKKKRQRKCDE